MRHILLTSLSIIVPCVAMAQWATNDNNINNTNIGNVGVGTSTPSTKLDVAGSLNLSAGSQYNIGGVRMLSANGTQNMFLGSGSGNAITSGQRNSFFGFQSGPLVTTGSNNAFIGYRTGYVNTTGGNNIFIGSQTGFSNTTGSFNAFFGTNAGYSNTTADYGLMLGYFAGYSNTTGTHNAFIGYQAGYTNQTGNYNVALGSRAGYKGTGSYNAYIGYQAGRETTTGENNAYFGNRAGYLSTTGGSNTFIGNSAGDNNTSGSQNTYIGSNAKGTALLTNATAIGANASVTANNSLVLGNSANVGIGVSAPSQLLHVDGNARISGSIFDSNNDAGTSAQVLSSTGAGTDWVNIVGMPVGSTGQTLINTNGTWSSSSNLFHNGTNVGIGNAAPTAKLHVTGDVRVTGGFSDRNNDPGSAGQVLSSTGAGTDWITLTGLPSGGSGQTLYHNGSNWLSGINLFNNGTNVGIGTDAPASKLHVNGDVRINGALRDSNNDPGVSNFVMTSTGTGTDWKDVCTIVSECEGIGPGIGGWGYDSVAVSGSNGESTYLYSANSIVANIDDISGSMVFSAKGVGYNGNAADATRLTYMPSMAAFRAGTDDQGNWNPENQGYGSAAFGRNTIAVGDYTVASGFETRAEGFGAVAYGHSTRALGGQSAAFGYQTQAYGDGAFAAGSFGTAEGSGSAVFGYENYGAGAFSFAAGQGNMALTYAETVLGYYATQQEGSANSPESNDRLFAIGNGLAGARSNAMVAMKNGRVGIGPNSPTARLQVTSPATSLDNVGFFSTSYVGNQDVRGVLATSVTAAGYGIGVESSGGYIGTLTNVNGGAYTGLATAITCNASGTAGSRYGVYAISSVTGGSGTSYGVYAYASGGSSTYSGYFAGNVYSTGQYLPSDRQLKRNVNDMADAISIISKLKVRTYEYETEKFPTMALQKGIRYGFVADEMKEVMPQFVMAAKQPLNAQFDENGNRQEVEYLDFEAVNYTELVPILVKGVQELNEKVNASAPENTSTKAELDAAKAEIAELRALVNKLIDNQKQFEGDLQQCCFDHVGGTRVDGRGTSGLMDTAKLEQNRPNPFNENTTIKYYLPNGTRTASIAITDLNGVQLKSFDLSGGRGVGQVLISGGAFAAGTYVYTLTVNGKLVDSKRMVLM